MSAYDILTERGVDRLCHFTKLQSLTHIISNETGVLASSLIHRDTKCVTDTLRYDHELDYVCCSIQYPNSWFLQSAIQKNQDKIFREWVVLYIDVNILNYKTAKFCPCNASKDHGRYINNNIDEIEKVFADSVSTFLYPRSLKMLPACPTDGQAEILVKDNIPREYIIGIATYDEEVAGRVFSMLEMYAMKQIPIYISQEVFTPTGSNMIKNGCKPDELLFTCIEGG